jgi:hypothetical protein
MVVSYGPDTRAPGGGSRQMRARAIASRRCSGDTRRSWSARDGSDATGVGAIRAGSDERTTRPAIHTATTQSTTLATISPIRRRTESRGCNSCAGRRPRPG